MSIVENSASDIGDIVLIQSFTPLFGILNLTGYVDSTSGETSTRFWKREFSYSIDGVFFSDWTPLTNADLMQIIVQATDAFYINYRYTRSGTDITGILSFQSITLNGQFEQPLCENYHILPKSIFKDLFCYNPAHSHICAILTNKLFQTGILPEYITRNQTDNPAIDDADFLSFWGTVCCFYALILVYTQDLEKFYINKNYLLEYLRERDIFACDSIDLQDLQYIKSNYFDEIRQRGTVQIFIPKNDTKSVDGEFLRLICYSIGDEFIFDLITDNRLGWWLGYSSPQYKGNVLSTQTIKNKEKTNDFVDLTKYNTFTGNGGTVTIQTDGSKKIALLAGVPNTFEVGFSYDLNNPLTTNFDNAIAVNDGVDYEISFWIKQNINANNITFGCYGLDSNNNNISLLDSVLGITQQFFFQKQILNQTNTYYFVKGIVYNKHKTLIANDQARLNIGYGKNLKMVDGVSKIIPILLLDRTSNPDINSDLYVWDFKVKPLVTGAVANEVYNDFSEIPSVSNAPLSGSFGTCFLTSRNLLHIMYKNGNPSIQISDIETAARNKLIPYNSVLKTTILE